MLFGYYVLIVQFNISSTIPPNLFFLKITVAIRSLLWFCRRNICSTTVKYIIGILAEIVLNL